ncbi:MAG: hypothetical protein D6697_10970 [Armatimonadetes bacterium]|jgi:hypothetical protein|nr:MAG: hypothetical protein D6697_10970 [Armatimonadota bacterium]
MKGSTLLSAVALTTMLVITAGAQKSVPSTGLHEVDVRTAVIPENALSVQKIYPQNIFFPAGSAADPYIYLCANWGYPIPTGTGAGDVSLTYFNPGDFATNEYADDIILAGGSTFLPLAHPNSTACLSEVTVGIYLGAASVGDVTLRIRIYGWDGSIATTSQYPDPLNVTGDANLIWDSGATPLNYGPLQPGIYLLTVPVPNVPVSKALYISTILGGMPTTGGLIIAHGPGNVYLMPSRGDFRRKSPSARFTFVTATQGSFLINLRGKYNFVGQVDMSALSVRAQPKDPVLQWFDEDNDGVEEALRRNLVDVEVVNDSGVQPFTSRFTTYLDENGRFTLPVSGAIASIKVRRWDNGLAVAFSRPAGGWSADVCDPTTESASMTFGDVNGDGIIDDADLLSVLFGFGSGE